MRKEQRPENATSKSVVIKLNMNNKYDDIINLPHHVSKTHPQMSIYDRSAQFAPFAALVGYEEAIEESSIKGDKRIILGNDKIEELSHDLFLLSLHIEDKPQIEITYYEKNKKSGHYVRYKGQLIKIDNLEKCLVFANKRKINIYDIIDINML